jgi:hypothetical protein
VCGAIEYWASTSEPDDVAYMLYKNGSFSVEHLLADGYSEEDAKRIASHFEGLPE